MTVAATEKTAHLNGPASDAIMGGRKGVANFINLAFQGRINTPSGFVNQMGLTRWLRGEFLPVRCQEFFPAPDGAGRFSQSAVRLWVEKYLVKRPACANLPVLGDVEDTDEAIKREKLRRLRDSNDAYERRMDSRYMLVADHHASLQRFGSAVWHRFCLLVEVDLVAAASDAFNKRLTPDQFAADLRARHCAAIDALQREFARYARGSTAEPDPAASSLPEPAAAPPLESGAQQQEPQIH